MTLTFDVFLPSLLALSQRSPVVALALAISVLLPMVALIAFFLRWTSARLAGPLPPDERALADAADLAAVTPWPTAARLIIETGALPVTGRADVPLGLSPMRIGGDGASDVKLVDTEAAALSVIVHHDADHGFVLTDVSARESAGVRVNGGRVATVQLVDGDRIELGAARLRFERLPI
jgi:hypothetical protein